MKGAALFLFTIVMLTPGNRTAVQAYVDQTTARLAAESPFPQVVLVSTGLIALMLMFILRDQRPARQTRFIVLKEIRGPAGDEAGRRVLERRQFCNTGRLTRIMRVLLIVRPSRLRRSGSTPNAHRRLFSPQR
jgi:hypothetical protein